VEDKRRKREPQDERKGGCRLRAHVLATLAPKTPPAQLIKHTAEQVVQRATHCAIQLLLGEWTRDSMPEAIFIYPRPDQESETRKRVLGKSEQNPRKPTKKHRVSSSHTRPSIPRAEDIQESRPGNIRMQIIISRLGKGTLQRALQSDLRPLVRRWRRGEEKLQKPVGKKENNGTCSSRK